MWHHKDNLGTNELISYTPPEGTLNQADTKSPVRAGTNTYVLGPFGEMENHWEHWDYRRGFVYTGKMYDEEIGMYYFHARYVDGDGGRFVSEDPIKGVLSDPQTLNSYVYVRNNPVRYIDPDGLFWAEAGQFALSVGRTAGKEALKFGAVNALAQYAMGNENIGQSFLEGARSGGIYGGVKGGHYGRNVWNKAPDQMPRDYSWSRVEAPKDSLHQYAVQDRNIKMVSGRSEGIYNPVTLAIDTSDENMGTFNFISDEVSSIGHGVVDALPYLFWGNTSSDSTSFSLRTKVSFEALFSNSK